MTISQLRFDSSQLKALSQSDCQAHLCDSITVVWYLFYGITVINVRELQCGHTTFVLFQHATKEHSLKTVQI